MIGIFFFLFLISHIPISVAPESSLDLLADAATNAQTLEVVGNSLAPSSQDHVPQMHFPDLPRIAPIIHHGAAPPSQIYLRRNTFSHDRNARRGKKKVRSKSVGTMTDILPKKDISNDLLTDTIDQFVRHFGPKSAEATRTERQNQDLDLRLMSNSPDFLMDLLEQTLDREKVIRFLKGKYISNKINKEFLSMLIKSMANHFSNYGIFENHYSLMIYDMINNGVVGLSFIKNILREMHEKEQLSDVQLNEIAGFMKHNWFYNTF